MSKAPPHFTAGRLRLVKSRGRPYNTVNYHSIYLCTRAMITG
ncbi:unnamed protein product [Rhodiola kirilowii]